MTDRDQKSEVKSGFFAVDRLIWARLCVPGMMNEVGRRPGSAARTFFEDFGAHAIIVRPDLAAAHRHHHRCRRLIGSDRTTRWDQHCPGNRRCDGMAVMAGAGFVVIELVFDDVAALDAQRFVELRQ